VMRLRKGTRRSNLFFKFLGNWIFTNLSEDLILILNNALFFYKGIFYFQNIIFCSKAPERSRQLCIIRFFLIRILLVRQHAILWIFCIVLLISEASISKMALRTRCSSFIIEFSEELICPLIWRPNNAL
jgi:hypothetical protein